MNPVRYLGEVRSELSKVTWPKAAEVVRLTLLVILISAIIGAYLGGLDLVFIKLLDILLVK